VRVDGRVARLGERADPERQRITLDGRPVTPERPTYWVVHKPRGVLTAVGDARGRRTVVELLPPGLPRLYPVGRLDLDTEGLVLLTNDGALAHALLHPSLGSEREYRVTARGRMASEALARLARGVVLDDGPTAPARIGAVRFDASADATRFTLVLREGRKRQIRRALAALGHPVLRLVRTRTGPLRLGRLPAGAARPLGAGEVAALRRHARTLRAGRGAGSPGRLGAGSQTEALPARAGTRRRKRTKARPTSRSPRRTV
jgi:pseudouridine synthase